jgi:hypothetical protein
VAVSNHDEDRSLLDAYAQATSPSPSEVERALTRTLARIDSEERAASLPDRRRTFVWVAAAGLATLVVASAAVASVRWYQARPQPDGQTYGAARLDLQDDSVEARATLRAPADSQVAEPVREIAQPMIEIEPEPVAETSEPSSTPAPEPRRRGRTKAPEPIESTTQPTAPAAPSDSASELAAESRLLGQIRRALRDNDFEAALAVAEQHARRHPQGSLTEERLILEAVAACRAGQRSRGLAAAKQLREQFPSTSALAKVEQSCAGD